MPAPLTPNRPPSTPPLLGRRRLSVLGALATGLLMALAFPRWDFDALIWVTLVPLFAGARGAGGRRGLLLGWLAGMVLESLGFSWILHAILSFTGFNGLLAPVAWLGFLAWLLYASIPWAALGWLLGRCRVPGAVHAVIPLWVAIEQYFPRLFPWHVGGAVYGREWLRQGADLFGASGLTYLVLLANAAIYLLLEWKAGRRPFPRWTLGLAGFLVAAANLYGAWRVDALSAQLERKPSLRIGCIQPFLQPGVKHLKSDQSGQFFWRLIDQTRDLAARQKPDLILWPEGVDPIPFDPEAGHDPLARHRQRDGKSVFDEIPVPLVIGGGSADGEKRVWGSAAYIQPAGAAPDPQRTSLYHKNIRLLFGEMVPFEDYLPRWIKDRVSVGTLEAGTDCPLFTLRAGPLVGPVQASHRFRVLICYEAILQGFSRKVAEGADFLVNLTEDIWYGDTSHIGQHASVLALRAVENRIPLARCTNIGPSGVVDVLGRFDDRTAVFRADQKVAVLKPGAFFSVYKSGGYLFPAACLAACLAIGVYVFIRYIFKNS